jgi:V8-like Glu-specific endopeptidase
MELITGTGTLVTSCTVLTAAHNLFYFKEGINKKDKKLVKIKPHQFCLGVYEDIEHSTKIDIVDWRYPK